MHGKLAFSHVTISAVVQTPRLLPLAIVAFSNATPRRCSGLYQQRINDRPSVGLGGLGCVRPS